jgi:hypothetical protein
MTRRLLTVLVSVIVLCSIAAGAYLAYRSHSSARDAQLMEIAESTEWRQAPLKRCLAMIRQEDNYALFEDNKRRIEKWCDGIDTCRARYRDCLSLKQIPSSECRGIYQDCIRYTCNAGPVGRPSWPGFPGEP